MRSPGREQSTDRAWPTKLSSHIRRPTKESGGEKKAEGVAKPHSGQKKKWFQGGAVLSAGKWMSKMWVWKEPTDLQHGGLW